MNKTQDQDQDQDQDLRPKPKIQDEKEGEPSNDPAYEAGALTEGMSRDGGQTGHSAAARRWQTTRNSGVVPLPRHGDGGRLLPVELLLWDGRVAAGRTGVGG